MTGSPSKSRVRFVLGRVLLFSVPLLFSSILFLILYNNVYNGRLILAILLGANALILACPTGHKGKEALAVVKFGSVCAVSLFAAVWLVEALFPQMVPAEYVKVRDLARGPRDSHRKDLRWFTTVFTNGDQRRYLPASTGPGTPDRTSWHVPGGRLEYYGYDPNENLRYVNVIRWNSHGYFDNDYGYSKRNGVFRIVVIGDSYVESMQVPLRMSFHKLLEKSLNDEPGESGGTGRRFEIIALGNSGTGQANNLRVLKEEAVKYDPDAVVMTLCTNDFCDDSAALRVERNLATGQVTTLFRDLVRHGFLAAAFVLRRFNELRRERYRVSPELLQWAARPPRRIDAAWNHTLSMVKQSRDYCAERGIRFVLVYLGSELEVKYAINPQRTMSRLAEVPASDKLGGWDLTATERRVTGFCRKEGITLISLLPSLIEAQRSTGKLVFGDHYTMFGHRVVSRTLETGLKTTILRNRFTRSVQRPFGARSLLLNHVGSPQGSRVSWPPAESR